MFGSKKKIEKISGLDWLVVAVVEPDTQKQRKGFQKARSQVETCIVVKTKYPKLVPFEEELALCFELFLTLVILVFI